VAYIIKTASSTKGLAT